MGAKYIFRLDDITPTMDWKQFWTYLELFKEKHVVPLLGLVPDNQDTMLRVEKENDKFWDIMRELQESGMVEIAQHGYRHKLEIAKTNGKLGFSFGRKNLTEFAGNVYEVQLEKVKNGMNILREKKIFTDVWMAPSHSFDNTTIRVLRELGFKSVTDGIALYPYKIEGLVFIPQQLWKPKRFPCGFWTICLHLNHADEKMLYKVRRHLESGARCISFSEAVREKEGVTVITRSVNILFRWVYMLCFLLKKTLKTREVS